MIAAGTAAPASGLRKVSQITPSAHAAASYTRSLPVPNGITAGERHAGAVTSGTRSLQWLLSTGFAVLVAGNAGHPHEDGTGAVWVAPELLAALDSRGVSGCMQDVVIESAHMQGDGRVAFEWHPATGELSFVAAPGAEVTRPEDPSTSASPQLLPLAMQSCGSR
jgi:hypothetical protein